MSFSKRQEFETDVLCHVREVLLQCDRHRIPVFMTFAVEDSEEGTKYVSDMLSSANLGVPLKDDLLVKHALIMAGFDAVPAQKRFVYEEEQEVVSVESKQEEPADGSAFIGRENTLEEMDLTELDDEEADTESTASDDQDQDKESTADKEGREENRV